MAVYASYGHGPIICVLNPYLVAELTKEELIEAAGINNCEIVVMDAITSNASDFPFELKLPKPYSWCKNGDKSSGAAFHKRTAKKMRNIRARRSK